MGDSGSTVLKVQRYKSEGRWFDSRWRHWNTLLMGDRGSTVLKVQRYKSEGRWFDSRWRQWNFSLT